MAYQPLNLSTSNDGLGEGLRDGGVKINANFVELYGLVGTGGVTSVSGLSGTVSTAALLAALNVASGATADQTGAEIKTAYEGEADSNGFTDSEKAKLANIPADTATDLAGKASLVHTHVIADTTGLQAGLDGKVDDGQVLTDVPAGAVFTDTVADLTGLAPLIHSHVVADTTGLQVALDGKSPTVHTHTAADVGLGNVDNTADVNKPISTAGAAKNAAQDALIAAVVTEQTIDSLSEDVVGNPAAFLVTSIDEKVALSTVYAAAKIPTGRTVTTNTTLALTDANAVVDVTGAGNVTITVPLNATVAFPLYTAIDILSRAAATVTIQFAAGVFINGVDGGTLTIEPYKQVVPRKIVTDVWQCEA